MLLSILPRLLSAFPQAPEVVFGEVSIVQTDSNTMSIATSDRAIINYKEFNIAPIERVEFLQPSSSSTVLNRVIGQNPSQILGKITSNGKVFLVNPQGVYFGKEATVDTGSLVVSTLDILDQDFLEDRFFFHAREGIFPSFIHNEGALSATDIILLSAKIKNEGTIRASLNKVLLAGAESITLTFSSDGLMSFEIEEDVKEGLIEHFGNIEANEVLIHIGQAKEAIQNAINVDGLAEGNAIIKENGKIRIAHQSKIKANSTFIEASKVAIEGEIDVANEEIGGTVHVLGDHLELLGAYIDASGRLGGGTVLIGGEYKGEGGIRRALTNFMDENSCIKANAIDEGDGGRVILWADDSTLFNGTIFVKGGEISGNGGFVETSGKERLGTLTGRVDALAPHGKVGTWLLDPLTITIVGGSSGTIGTGSGAVGNCADVISDPYSIGITTINNSTANVSLCASSTSSGAINQNSQTINITTSGVGIEFKGSSGSASPVTLNANITTNAGAITFTNAAVTLGATTTLSSTGGNISFDATSTINATTAGTQGVTLSAGAGTVTLLTTVGDTTALGNFTASSSNVGLQAINFGGNITTRGGTITTSTASVTLTNTITIDSTNSGASTGAAISLRNVNATTAGVQGIIINAGSAGTIFISGVTGTSVALGSFSATSSSSSLLAVRVGTVTTQGGGITMTGNVSVPANAVWTGTSISVSSVINGTSAGAQTLTVNAGTSGPITFPSTVGATTRLAAIIISSGAGTSTLSIGGNISANSFTVTNSVPTTLTLAGTTTINTSVNNGVISFGGTINGTTTGSQALVLNAGSSTITLSGAVGNTTALGAFTATSTSASATAIRVRDIKTSNGIITMTGIVSLPASATLDTTNGGVSSGANISFSSTLNGTTAGTQALTVTGGTGTLTFTGAVGATTALLSLTATNATITQTSTAKTTGDLTYTGSTAINIQGNITTSGGIVTMTGPVILTNAVSIDSTNAGGTVAGANINFAGSTSTIDFSVANTLTLSAGTTGNIIFSSSVGATTAPTNITFTTSNAIQLGQSITVSGANPLTFSQPVQLNGTTTITSNNASISFSSTLDGAQPLTITGGSGTTTFTGAVGGITPLTILSATSATITQTLSAKTSGALNYTGITAINVQGNITTGGGTISLTGPVVLANSPIFDTTSGSPSGANINFSNTVDGAAVLTVLGGSTGGISFSGIVGGVTPLSSVTLTSGSIIQSSSLTSSGAVIYTNGSSSTIAGAISAGSFSQSGGGAISLGASITATSTLLFTNTVTFTTALSLVAPTSITVGEMSSNSVYNLTLTSSSGSITALQLGSPSEIINTLTMTALSINTPLIYADTVIFNGSPAINANIVAPGADLEFAAPVTVASGTFIVDVTGGSSAGSITFDSTLDGPGGLNFIVGAGDLTFDGIIGGITPFGNATVTSSENVTLFQSFTGSSFTQTAGSGTTTIAGTMTTTTITGISLTGNIFDVAGALVTTASGPVTISNSGLLTLSNTITSNGPVSHLTGSISLASSVTIDTSAGNGNISFSSSSTLNGAQNLSLNAGTGTVAFSGIVGGTTPLTNLVFTSAGLIQIGSNITVTGANPLVFSEPVSLIADSEITNSNNNITFSSTINGASSLIVQAGTGTVTFSGIVGGTTPLESLTATGGILSQNDALETSGALTYTAAAINILANITTSGGAIRMAGPVLLTNNPSFDSTNSGGSATGANITFSNVLNGADATESLMMLAGTLGTVSFEGDVGGITPFVDVTITAALIQIGANVTVTGANPLIFSSPVSMTGVSEITSNNANISFGDKLDGGGALTLTHGTGTLTFTIAVGSVTPLSSLTATGSSITQDSSLQAVGAVTYTGSALNIGGSIITSGGVITMTGPVVLTNTATFDSTNAGGSAIGANINFSATLDGAEDLTLAAGIVGIITFSDTVGATTPLTNLAFTNGALIQIGDNITVSGANPLNFTDPVSLTGASTITSNNANLTFSSTLDGSHPLILLAGTGTVTFAETVGGDVRLPSLTVTGGAIGQNSSLSSSGAVIYTNSGLLTIKDTLSVGSLHQSGGGTTLLEVGIVAKSSIFFANSITFNDSLSLIAAGSGGITLQSAMTSASDGIDDLTLSALAGMITAPQLGSVSDYINVLTLMTPAFNITSIYANTVIQNGSDTINSNITAPGASIYFTSPTTVAAGTFIVDVSGGSSPGSISFSSTLDGPGGLTFIVEEGSLKFNDNVGGIVAFGDASVTSAQNVLVSKDFTGSSFSQLAGSGTTEILGTMRTTASTGVSLTGTILDVMGPISTTGSGPVYFDNSGLLTLANTINSDGTVSQTGGGSISFGSTITATNAIAANAAVSFTNAVTLINDASINTSIGGGDITFGALATVNGFYNLTYVAGSGDISLNGEIGGLTPINVLTIYSADDLSLPATTASALKQVAGIGTTTVEGILTATGNFGIDITANILTINATIQTLGKGSIILQNSGPLTLNTGAEIKSAGALVRKGSTATNLSGNITTR